MDKFCSLAFGSISSGEFNKSRVCCNNPSPVLDDSGSPILVDDNNLIVVNSTFLCQGLITRIRKTVLSVEKSVIDYFIV